MNLAIVQPVPDALHPAPLYRDEVTLLAACLTRAGHTVGLTVTAPSAESALADRMADTRPDLVLMYVEGLAADVAVRSAGTLAAVLGAPLVVFGPHARQCPDACLSLAGAEAVAVAPADQAVPSYLAARGGRVDSIRTAGLWIKCETGVMRNPAPPPPQSLASDPVPVRGLYRSDQTLDAAGFAPIVAARGGEHGAGATATTGPPLPAPAAGSAPWPVLHRSLDAVLQEMHAVGETQLDLGGWRLGNRRWAADADWLAGFAGRYAHDVGLPIRTTLDPADVTAETAGLLARAGCEEVGLPLGAASNLIRTEVLGLSVTPEAVGAAIGHLREAGVRTAVHVEVGTPYETQVTLDETVAMLRRLDPDRVRVTLHWPAPGSPAERIAQEHGWLAPAPGPAHVAGRPAVVTPSLSAEAILRARDLLPWQVLRPGIVPLLRLAWRVKIPGRGTAYDWLVRPLLPPPLRKG